MQEHKRIRKTAVWGAWMLLIVLVSGTAAAYVDLIAPKAGAHLRSHNLSMDYYPELEGGVDECALRVDGNMLIVDSDVTSSQPNSFQLTNTPQGSYVWSVLCSNSQTGEEAVERNFTIDMGAPAVNLLSPADGVAVESSAELKFKVLDSYAPAMNCSVRLDNQHRGNISVSNNTQATYTLQGLNPGAHSWNVTCSDKAGNKGTAGRTFIASQATEFSISIDKETYSIGEAGELTITAPDTTNLTLEICPDGEGFVECFAAITLEDRDYPRKEILPYTNRTGSYVIDAYFAYKDIRETRKLTYSVANSIQVSIDSPSAVKSGQSATFTGSASGGSGALKYEWTLHNGTKKEGSTITISFPGKGSYTETLKVTDEAGNTATRQAVIAVNLAYDLTVIVKDSSGNSLEGVAVEINNEKEETGPDGTAVFLTKEGTHDIFAFLTGYELYEGRVTSDREKEISIALTPKQEDLQLTIVSPESGSEVTSGTVEFRYSLKGASNAECILYTDKAADGFYSEQAKMTVKDEEEKVFSIELVEGNYNWVIECTQGGKEVENPDISLIVTPMKENKEKVAESQTSTSQAGQEATAGFDKDSMLNVLSQVMENHARMGAKERSVAESLGFIEQASGTLKQVQRAARDIHDLRYRTSMTEEEKEAARKKTLEEISKSYNDVVKELSVLDSKNFVKYAEKDEILPAVEAFAESTEFQGKIEDLAKAVQALQGTILVSTKASVIKIERLDGTKQELTVVTKEIKTDPAPEGSYILEEVPKEIAQSADQLTVIGKYEVIKDDPVLKFPLTEKITYYVEGKINPEEMEATNTLLVHEGLAGDLKGITGSATFVLPDVDLGSKSFLMSVAIILLLIYFLSGSPIWHNALSRIGKKQREKEIHYARVLINDALDNLEAGNYDKASLIYREVKLTYDNMQDAAREAVYDNVIGLVNKLDIAYSRELSSKIEEALAAGDYSLAHDLYRRLQATYRKLDEDYRKEIYGKITAITGKMKS